MLHSYLPLWPSLYFVQRSICCLIPRFRFCKIGTGFSFGLPPLLCHFTYFWSTLIDALPLLSRIRWSIFTLNLNRSYNRRLPRINSTRQPFFDSCHPFINQPLYKTRFRLQLWLVFTLITTRDESLIITDFWYIRSMEQPCWPWYRFSLYIYIYTAIKISKV
jgi:hypothetical protein